MFLKTIVKRTLRPYSLYFPQNTLMLTESREEFSDLHSIFRLCALRYSLTLSKRAVFGIVSRRFGGFMTPLSRVQMRIKLTNASLRVTTDLHSGGGYTNTLARIDSVCTFKLGVNCLMLTISLTRQSNLLMHFLRTLKQLRRSSGTAPAWSLS